MRIYENSNFNLSKTMLRKIKAQQYIQDDGTAIPELYPIFSNFKFVHKQCKNQRVNQFIKQLAALVEYQQINEGLFIAEHNTTDIFFILKGDVIAVQERGQRSIMQDQFWHHKLQIKKKELHDAFDLNKKQEIMAEIEKIERVHKYFSDVLVEEYLRSDLFRYSQNFNLEDDCKFKEFAIIKPGMTFGKNQNNFLVDKENIKGDVEVYIQNELKQRKVRFIAGKNLHVFRLSVESQQVLFSEYYQCKQKIIEFLQQKLQSLRGDYKLTDFIANRAHQIQLFEGSALYLQNSEKPTHFYLLINGLVEISTLNIKNSNQITYIEGPEIIGLEFVGEKSQFRQYSARCKSENMEVYKISYQEVQNLPDNVQFMEEINKLGLQQNNYFKQLVNQKLELYKIQRSIFSTKLQKIYFESPRHISAKFFSPSNIYQIQSNKSTQRFSTQLENFFSSTEGFQKDSHQSPIKSKETLFSPKFSDSHKQTAKSQNFLSKLSTNDQLNSSHQKLNSTSNLGQEKNEETLEQIANQKLKQYLIKNQMLRINTQETDKDETYLYFQNAQQLSSQKKRPSSQNNNLKFNNSHRKLKFQNNSNSNQSSLQGLDSFSNQNINIPNSLISQFIPQLQQCFYNK